MERSDYHITLDLQSSQASKALELHEKDTHCRLHITLTQGGKEYVLSEGCQAVFTAKKPDGTAIFNDCTLENGSLFYDITPQTTAAAGELACQLRLYGQDGQLLHSAAFSMVVHPGTVSDDDDIASMPEATALQKILEKLEKKPTYRLIEKVTLEEAVTSFKRAADPEGKPYNFSAMVINVKSPAATADAQLIFSLRSATKQLLYHQVSNGLTTSASVAYCKVFNDQGMTEYQICAGKNDFPVNISKKSNYTSFMWENVKDITLITYVVSGEVLIPAGTTVTIYAIEEDANA